MSGDGNNTTGSKDIADIDHHGAGSGGPGTEGRARRCAERAEHKWDGDIADYAGEKIKRANDGVRERSGVRGEGKVDGGEAVGRDPINMRRQNRGAGGNGQARPRRKDIGGAARVA